MLYGFFDKYLYKCTLITHVNDNVNELNVFITWKTHRMIIALLYLLMHNKYIHTIYNNKG